MQGEQPRLCLFAKTLHATFTLRQHVSEKSQSLPKGSKEAGKPPPSAGEQYTGEYGRVQTH